MDQQYPTVAKIPVLDTGKFKQWQFRMRQYLQHEHYALWEVIEFEDSYEAPANDPSTTTTNTTSGEAGTKSGRTVTLTTEDMQKKKNDVKARTTLLLSLLDEHQLRFSKYKTARELWAAILKTFGGNEATKKTKKNLLKQQYGNFRAEGSENLEQTFTRLQVIVGQLQGNDEVNTASVYTTSSNVPTAGANVTTVSINQETACAYIASQSSGSQIKFEDINQIDEDDMEEMGHFARECRAPRNQDRGRRDNYRQGSKAEEQAPKALMAIDRVGWDCSYMANDEKDHALLADLPPSCKPLGCKWIFKRKLKVDRTIEKFKARLVIQGFKQKSEIDYLDTYAPVARISTIRLLIAITSIYNLIIHQMDVKTTFLNGDLDVESHYIGMVLKKFNYFDCTLVSTLMDTSEKLMPNNDQTVSQLKYPRVISCLMYTMTCTRPDIEFVVGKLSSNTEDNSSTSGWVFLLGGGAISWASKKQTYITSLTMKTEFVALATAGKEAEWLKNLILKISL
nr:zinc finger, CCHC-type [Tanacetum cinerariifolium]